MLNGSSDDGGKVIEFELFQKIDILENRLTQINKTPKALGSLLKTGFKNLLDQFFRDNKINSVIVRKLEKRFAEEL